MARNNTVILTGNLCDMPEYHKVPGNKDYVDVRIATQDSYKDDQGNWVQQDAVFHRVRFFSRASVTHALFYSTGQRVRIKGTLRYYKVASHDGKGYNVASIIGHSIEPAPLPQKTTAPQEEAPIIEEVTS